MTHDSFWIYNPKVLVTDKVIPSCSTMTFDEILNSLTTLTLLVGFAITVYSEKIVFMIIGEVKNFI